MEEFRRWAPLLTVIALTLCIELRVAQRLRALASVRASAMLRRAVTVGAVVLALWMVVVPPAMMSNHGAGLPSAAVTYLMALSLGLVIVLISALLYLEAHHTFTVEPSRRHFLKIAAPVAAAPLLASAYGFHVARRGPRLVEVNLHFAGLPSDLNGLRLVQLTDIHFGPFLDAADLAYAVGMANETRAHVALLTGDLVTRAGDDMEGCLNVLARLKAEAGVFACHGNHESYAGAIPLVARLAPPLGIQYLIRQHRVLRFGAARLNVAGLNYQPPSRPYLAGAESLVVPSALNLLLQHNPDVFPRAVEAGFDLTLSGHTHGGQLNVELARANLNVARIFTPFTRGHYSRRGGQLYVSSGVGTIGVPLRIGAPPEVTLIRLCAG